MAWRFRIAKGAGAGARPIDSAARGPSNAFMSVIDRPGGGLGAGLRAAVSAGLDLVLPHLCLGCGTVVGSAAGLCGACWERITFIAPPLCVRCGAPFEIAALEARGFAAGDGTAQAIDGGPVCGACRRDPPPWARARAAFAYDEASRSLVLAFKHADRTDAAPALARLMARAAGPLVGEAEIVVPVPLHRWRLVARRYNQAALLAGYVGRGTCAPCLADGLIRTRATPSQGRLSRRQRRLNVRGAFAVNPRHAGRLEGRRVMLVDDVLTTGATVAAAARCLLGAGAASVDVLTLARVVRPTR